MGIKSSSRKIITFLVVFILVLLFKASFPEERKNFKPRFSFKLTGGWGYVAIGDINKTLKSFNNNPQFTYARLYNPEVISGEITTLSNRINDWEVELRMDFSPKLAIGVSTLLPIQRKNESSVTFEGFWYWYRRVTYTYKPELNTWMPIRASLYYTQPLILEANIVFSAGIGLYSASLFRYREYNDIRYLPEEVSYWQRGYWKTKHRASFGLHAGIGLEYNLTKNIALVVEAEGRYIKIKNLRAISVSSQ